MSRKEIRFLFKHSSIYGIGTIVGQAVGFFLLPLYTHYLSPSDYGVAVLIELSISLVGITISSGLAESLPRFYYEDQDEQKRKRTVSTQYGILLLFTAVVFPLSYGCAPFLSEFLFHSVIYVRHIRIAALALFLGIMVDLGLLYYRVKNQAVKNVSISLLTLFLLIGCNLYFLAVAGTGLIGIFYSMLLVRMVLVGLVTVPIIWEVGWGFSTRLARKMLPYSFPLIFSNILRNLVSESDKYFINYFFSPYETGIYTIANKIGTSVHLLITSPFLQGFIPRRFEIMNREDAQETYASVFYYYLLILGTAGLGLSMFSPEVLSLMATSKFYGAAEYVPLIVLAWIIFGVRYHFETGILIKRKTKYFAYINGFTAIVNLALNYLLIPLYQIWGALMALNISQLLTTSLFYWVSQRLYPIKYDLFFAARLMLGLSLLFGASVFVTTRQIHWSLLWKAGLLALYPVLLYLLRLMKVEDLRKIKKTVIRFMNLELADNPPR
jgi:O-antigen/teichoic acid export membrane protein